MSKPKKSRDNKVRFYEKSHKYKLKGKDLVSVTSFLSTFFDPFDADKIAKIKAWQSKRNGIKGQGVRYWKAQWKKSSEDGTTVHNALEQYVNGGDEPKLADELLTKYTYGKEWLGKYFKTVGEPVKHPEVIVYDEELELAGQIDLFVERNDFDDTSNKRYVDLIDYKTNKAIHKEGYKNKKCKEPIEDMPDCSFTKYTLQLSMYAYMLEQKGVRIGDLILLHLTPEGAVPMVVEYRKDLIEKILEKKNDKTED